MKNLLSALRSNLNRVYGSIFALLILASLALFFLASAGSSLGTALVLGLFLLANLLVIVL